MDNIKQRSRASSSATVDHGIPHHKSGLGAAFTGTKAPADHPGNIARDGAVKKHAPVNVAWGQHRKVDGALTSLADPHNSTTETVQSGSGLTDINPVVSKNLSVPKVAWGSESQNDIHRQLGRLILDEAKRSAPGDHPAKLGRRTS
jgi:hypothetical protein